MQLIRRLLTVFIIVLISQTLLAQDDPMVYVTKTGKKYHVAGCTYLSKSSIPKKLSDVVDSYSPCLRCNPPTRGAQGTEYLNGSRKGISNTLENKLAPDSGTGKETRSGEKAIGTTPTGKTLYEGPRGGQYHYSKSGKKVYQKKKKY